MAIPLPHEFSQTVRQVEASQQRYYSSAASASWCAAPTWVLLLLLTMIVLFVTTWLALFLSKMVTRPLSALAEATQEISRGRLDYRVDVSAADEIGDLVRSFNRMAEELETSRRQIEASSRDAERGQRGTRPAPPPDGNHSREHSDRRAFAGCRAPRDPREPGAAAHVPSRRRCASGEQILRGASLADVFPPEVLEDFEPLLRRADRMGMTTSQMEMQLPRASLNVAVTVATLRHQGERSGYVVVFEDLSDLLKAQKQAAWREVARRVAHEIKNPLTPIALSAERIQRHLDRGHASRSGVA